MLRKKFCDRVLDNETSRRQYMELVDLVRRLHSMPVFGRMLWSLAYKVNKWLWSAHYNELPRTEGYTIAGRNKVIDLDSLTNRQWDVCWFECLGNL